MAILIDVSQIIIANMAIAQFEAKRDKTVIDEYFVRHMILNSLRLYNQQFKTYYGEMIICCDTKDTWRKKTFPYYKAKRHEDKEESPIDWSMIYHTMDGMISDLKQFFPYKVLKVDDCEADDILGILAANLKEPMVIVSGDKDMGQLLRYPNVKQLFHPITKKFIEIKDPASYLKELIIRGDKTDGVPNILSDDDTFVNEDKRQKSIFEKKLEVWLNKEPRDFCENNAVLANYGRNRILIDLECTPVELQDNIMDAYRQPANGNKQTITQYFMAHRMRNLLAVIGQF
jgi:5'-3' exonuclease